MNNSQSDSIFTKIIKGKIPVNKIYEDDSVIAFLDSSPLADGHTLVVPKIQIDHLWDLSDTDYQKLWSVAKNIANHLKNHFGTSRVIAMVEGFYVPHAHIHLIPADTEEVLVRRPGITPEPTQEELAKLAQKLKLN